jgi:hypothetical protein
MEKQRDWMDYAQLASSVAQNHQLGEIRSQLGKLNDAASQQQQAEMRTAVVRQTIFKLEDEFRRAKSLNKQTQYFALNNLCAVCGQMSAESALFDTYQDRDRLDALVDKIAIAIKSVEEQLSEQEVADAKQVDRYRLERSYFMEALRYWQTRTARQAVADQKAGLEQQMQAIAVQLQSVQLGAGPRNVIAACRGIAIVSGVLWGIAFFGGLMVESSAHQGEATSDVWAPIWLGLLVPVTFGLAGAFLHLATPEGEKRSRLEAERGNLALRLSAIDAQMRTQPIPVETHFDKLFESLKPNSVPTALEERVRERTAFIDHVVGSHLESIEAINLSDLVRESMDDVESKFLGTNELNLTPVPTTVPTATQVTNAPASTPFDWR